MKCLDRGLGQVFESLQNGAFVGGMLSEAKDALDTGLVSEVEECDAGIVVGESESLEEPSGDVLKESEGVGVLSVDDESDVDGAGVGERAESALLEASLAVRPLGPAVAVAELDGER